MSNILKMFDTVTLSEDGSWLHLNIPASEEKAYLDDKQKRPMRIKLQGPDCNTWVNFQRKSVREGDKKKSYEDTVLEDSQLFAKMTLGWENIPDATGKDLPFSFEAAVRLYRDYKDIRMQALKFVVSQENFTQKQPEL